MPSAVITPCGQGGLLLGLARGFDAIRQSGRIRPDAEDDRGSGSCMCADVGHVHGWHVGDGICH